MHGATIKIINIAFGKYVFYNYLGIIWTTHPSTLVDVSLTENDLLRSVNFSEICLWIKKVVRMNSSVLNLSRVTRKLLQQSRLESNTIFLGTRDSNGNCCTGFSGERKWHKSIFICPSLFPTIYHFVLFVYFCKPAVLSRGYIFDGDNRSLIGRAADSKERKEVHEMRVVAVGEWRVYGGLGDIITPPV